MPIRFASRGVLYKPPRCCWLFPFRRFFVKAIPFLQRICAPFDGHRSPGPDNTAKWARTYTVVENSFLFFFLSSFCFPTRYIYLAYISAEIFRRSPYIDFWLFLEHRCTPSACYIKLRNDVTRCAFLSSGAR